MFPSQYPDFLTATSNAFVSRRKYILSIFDCISEMWMKFRKFWKKEQYPSLIITEIIASERDVYLSVSKVLLQHTIR